MLRKRASTPHGLEDPNSVLGEAERAEMLRLWVAHEEVGVRERVGKVRARHPVLGTGVLHGEHGAA